MKTICLFLVFAFSNAVVHAQNKSIAKGNDYYREGRYEVAEIHYRKAGDDPVAAYNLANSLIRQKKHKEAISVLAEIEKQEDLKMRAAAFYNAGVIYSIEKDLVSAIAAYKACLRITPSDQQARENLQKALLEHKAEQKQKSQATESKISVSQANDKLKDLQEKERKLQKKLEGGKKGQSRENDW